MNTIFAPPASNYKSEDFEGFIWIPKIYITPNDNEKKPSKGIDLPIDENQPPPEEKPKESENQFEDPNNNFIPAVFQKWKGKDGESAHFTILICYGMNEDMGQIYHWARLLKDILHVNILCFDYSGYGLNKLSRKNSKLDSSVSDNFSEKQIYQDITNVYSYMIDTLKILPNQIILLGRYMGTGPVVHLATKLKGKRSESSSNLNRLKQSLIRISSKGELDSLSIDPPAGIMLFSPITSVLKWIKTQSNATTIFATDMFDNATKASSVKVPCYIVHGRTDPAFPAKMGRSLQEKFPSVWKYLELEDVNADEDDFLDTFLEFMSFLAPGKISVVKTIAAPEDSVYVSSPSQVVSRWLHQIKMQHYADTFLTNGYFDLALISTLQDIDLEAMGITDPAHRQAILDHAKQPQNKTPTKPVPVRTISVTHVDVQPSSSPTPQSRLARSPSPASDNLAVPLSTSPSPGSPKLSRSPSPGPASPVSARLRDLVSDSPHDFIKTQFNSPTWCTHCTTFIYGLFYQGYACKDCGYTAHTYCFLQAPQNCPKVKNSFSGKKAKTPKQDRKSKRLSKHPSNENSSSSYYKPVEHHPECEDV